MKKIFLLTGLFALMSVMLQAQMTIGINEAPQKFSVLELISGANKGLRLPQMNTTDRNAMQATAEFQAEKVNKAIGLLIFNTESGCEEIWNGTEWKSLCGSQGKADFTITDCSSITVNGTYYNGVSFTSGNYLVIPVTVAKAGVYQISAVPDPANGYYFTASGEFLTAGTMNITVPGQGLPVNYTLAGQLGDELVISLNGVELNCPGKPRIIIKDATVRPKFSIACASVTVSGVVKKNLAMNNTNKINMRLNVQSGSQGATYSLQTDVIDGIWYEGSGILNAAGSQEITLYGRGMATTTAPKEFTISSNSESTTATCKVTVQPVIASKKVIEFAYLGGSAYGMAAGRGWGTKDMLLSTMNFGSDINSIVKYEGFASIQNIAVGDELTVAILNSNRYMEQDIIVITYNVWIGTAARAMLVNYVNKGGILIYLSQRVESNTALLIGDMFGEAIPSPIDIGEACARHVLITTSINDEITNGPFGDVRGLQWGEDFANSCALTVIPHGAIVYSGTINANTGVSTSSGRVTLLRHPTKNFIWCGDSGFIRGDDTTGNTDTNSGESPAKLGVVTLNGIIYPKYPVEKPNYGSGGASTRMPVCNSIMFANMMSWALKMAEENGINSGQ